jgi:hypothetical protein
MLPEPIEQLNAFAKKIVGPLASLPAGHDARMRCTSDGITGPPGKKLIGPVKTSPGPRILFGPLRSVRLALTLAGHLGSLHDLATL